MSDVIAVKLPKVASEVPDGSGGKWFLDAEGQIVGGLSFVTYPDLNAPTDLFPATVLRTDEVEKRLTEGEEG